MDVFDIIGPVMIGPSSSHTAGAARLGRIGLALLGEPVKEAGIHLYGSFAKTYRGHGTDKALAAGILGLPPDDTRLRNSLEIAVQKDVHITFIEEQEDGGHPNTVLISLSGKNGRTAVMKGASVGGGNVMVMEINHMEVSFSCQSPTLIVLHKDTPGVIAAVAEEISRNHVNISNFHLARNYKGGVAVMTIEMDGMPKKPILKRLKEIPAVLDTTLLDAV